MKAIHRVHFLERLLPLVAAQFDEVVEVELDENVDHIYGTRGDPFIEITMEEDGERFSVRLVAEDGDAEPEP